MIYYKKFPFTELQGKLPCSEKPSKDSCHESKTSNPNLPSYFIKTPLLHLLQSSMGQHIQYNDWYMHWKIWSSNLGRNKRTTKHPHQFQCPPSLQHNENQSFFSGSKVASADSLTSHIHLETSLKINGAIPPLNLRPSILGKLYFTFTC